MKNCTYVFFIVVITIFMTTISKIYAQQNEYLPTDKVLSFNGKFISKNTNIKNKVFSENNMYRIEFEIASVSDENRDLRNLKLFTGEDYLFRLKNVPGSDILVSNSGYVVVFNMDKHFMQQVKIHIYNKEGNLLMTNNYSYASLFDFSPSGNKFIVGTDKFLEVIDLASMQTNHLEPCSKVAFSLNESFIATAFEDKLKIYQNCELIKQYNTELFYPRALALNPENDIVAVIGKNTLKAYSIQNTEELFTQEVEQPYSYRDLIFHNNSLLAGIHFKKDGVSKGILKVYKKDGEMVHSESLSEKKFKTFEKPSSVLKSTNDYDPIPWPFDPFNEVHKVWNHYEQHMGNASGDWSYLHQGLDLEVPIDEPTYAVQDGWVKLVLTLGGDAYWRVAVSPEQVSGYSDGWLYAHLVQSSIQVDVGDYVQVHDYLGDIIYWSNDWGHIHFVNIHDQGDIWYYDDGEWGINFNPLLALNPITDDVAPVIENYSTNSKFGYCQNETTNFLDPGDLHDEVDIIAKISDYHGDSEWEQPAYKTYYWIKKLPEDTLVVPKTLGQILNHSYEMYNGTYYQAYAPLMYYKDWSHHSPPWMNWDRDYWQVLTNNNGDSIAEPWETDLALNTADFMDGTYRIVVEVWDEYGNMAIDSQEVVFENYPVHVDELNNQSDNISIFPNPCQNEIFMNTKKFPAKSIIIFNSKMQMVRSISESEIYRTGNRYKLNIENLPEGIYYMQIDINNQSVLKKVVKM